MSKQIRSLKFLTLALSFCFLATTPGSGLAQSTSGPATEGPAPAQLIEALKQKATRGTTATAAETAEAEKRAQLIEALKAKAARGLSVSDRRELAEAVSDKPAIDLEINFDFNSSSISEQARPAVMALGRALTNPDLKTKSFMVAGHTDAKGRTGYNQKLSERRARAVKEYLMKNFSMSDGQLVVVGYGSERLKNATAPNSDENRRVQIVNISPAVAMQKP